MARQVRFKWGAVIAAAAVVFAGGLAGCGDTEAAKPGATQSWQGQGVSLTWGQGWHTGSYRVIRSPLESILGAPVLCGLSHGKPSGNILLLSRDLGADETLQSVFAGTYDRVVVDHPGSLRHLTGGTTTVDGLPALTKTYELPSGEPYYRYWDVWWESDGRLFVLAGWTYADHADEILADFESVRNQAKMLN
jgi:hypothetical protein